MTQEKQASPLPGLVGLVLFIAVQAGSIWFLIYSASNDHPFGAAAAGLVFILGVLTVNGFFTVQPNQGMVLTLVGNYAGTVRTPGWWWTHPLMKKRRISLRARSLNGQQIKVNDKDGNPVEIAAIVVWRVRNSAQATFDVDNYEQFVAVQSETAVRHLAGVHPYDTHQPDVVSLRGNMDQIGAFLKDELQVRLDPAGVEVVDPRLSHLAYGPEIASAMLRRQQAGAIVAARSQIVDGAVGMVEMALERLSRDKIIELDPERKAAMVSNLLVVLCSDHPANPVVNAGTLYT